MIPNQHIRSISLILILFFVAINCRKDELESNAPDALRNPSKGILQILGAGYSFGSFSGSGSNPRGFKSSGGSLFAIGSSASLYESTDGNTFTKKTFTLPGCTAVIGVSSGARYTDCNLVTVAKSGSTIYAIGIKQSGVRGSDFSQSTVTEHKFYFASGATVNDLNFVEISDTNLSSSYYLAGNVLPSAASSNGFIFGFGTNSSAHKYCGTGNTGSTWVCQNGVASSSSSAGAIALLNGTLAADIYFRWNGSGFTAAVTSNQGTKGSMVYSSGRTIYNSGNTFRYTATDPSAWAGTSLAGETTAVQSGGATSSYPWIGDISGTLKAIGSSSSSNSTAYTAHSSSDNGMNWSNQGTITIPGGLSLNSLIGSLNSTVFVYAQSSSGTFTQKYFKSSDFSSWTEVVP